MKYLVTVMQGITVEAEDEEDAKQVAAWLLDEGRGDTWDMEVEPLSRKENEGA